MRKQTALRFTDRIMEMIQEIKEKHGYKTMSAVVDQAIINFYKEELKKPSVYQPQPKKTPAEKAQAKLEEKNYHVVMSRDKGIERANALLWNIEGDAVRMYEYTIIKDLHSVNLNRTPEPDRLEKTETGVEPLIWLSEYDDEWFNTLKQRTFNGKEAEVKAMIANNLK